jgi:hypothetical protein
MPWGRLDDQLHVNGKVGAFSDKAFRLWVLSISYCNAKRGADPEGHLSADEAQVVRRLADATDDTIDELVARRGWDSHGDGYRVHDFQDYSPPTDPTNAERQRRFRAAHFTTFPMTNSVTPTVSNAVTNAPVTRDDRHGNGPPVPVPVPVPIPIPSPTERGGEQETKGGDTCVPAARTRARPPPSAGDPSLNDRRRRLLEALIADLGFPAATPAELRRVESAAAALARADPPVEPAEVGPLKRAWDAHYDVRCTPWTLADHVGELRHLVAHPAPRRRRGGPQTMREKLDVIARSTATIEARKAETRVTRVGRERSV